jgi:hypothetical protein
MGDDFVGHVPSLAEGFPMPAFSDRTQPRRPIKSPEGQGGIGECCCRAGDSARAACRYRDRKLTISSAYDRF